MSDAAEFSLSVSTEAATAVVRVQGDLDVATAPELREAVVDLVRRDMIQVVVDLAGLTFLDSSGLSVLVGAHKRLAERGGGLRLRSVPAQADKVLRLTGLVEVLAIEPVDGTGG